MLGGTYPVLRVNVAVAVANEGQQAICMAVDGRVMNGQPLALSREAKIARTVAAGE